MAFVRVLRRKLSAATPLAIRVTGNQPVNKSCFRQIRPVVNSSTDQSLIGVLDYEMKLLRKAVTLPEDFPFAMVESSPYGKYGASQYTMWRNYNNETIYVSVDHRYDCKDVGRTPITEDNYNYYYDGDHHYLYCDKMISFRVLVRKERTGQALEFNCLAQCNNIQICSIGVGEALSDYDFRYEEHCKYPSLENNFDERLQRAFKEYLEVRGIKPFQCSFWGRLQDWKRNKVLLEQVKAAKTRVCGHVADFVL